MLLSELGSYQPDLLERPRLVVGSKADLAGDDEGLCDLVLSAATGEGIGALTGRLAAMVQQARCACRGRGLERDRGAPPRARRSRRAAHA